MNLELPYKVSDADFKKLVAILRLAVPYTGLIMTARESEEIRNDVIDYVGKADRLDDAIRHHTHVQVERILGYQHIAEKVEKGDLLVKAAYYDVTTGKVSILQ